MAEADIFDLISRLRRHLLVCSMVQMVFAVSVVAVLLLVRSVDKAEIMRAIQHDKCDCAKHGNRQPNVHNENHINSSTPLDTLYLKLSQEYKNGLRTTTSGISERDVLCPNGSIDP